MSPVWNCALLAAMLAGSVALPAYASPRHQAPPSLTSTMEPVGAGFGAAPPPILPSTLDNPDFAAAINHQLLLTPGQIGVAKRIHDSVERAIVTPGTGVPTPLIRTIGVHLNAGSHPPLLHLANGNVTTLVFEDETGAPWPVTRVYTAKKSGVTASIVGNERPVSANKAKGGVARPARTSMTSNIVALLPEGSELVGKNVVVTLEGLDVPISFMVTAGDGKVDYRDDIDVPQYGPNSSPPAGSTGMPTLRKPGVQAFLDGVPPSGSRRLKCDDASVQAWFWKREMYVRTQDTLATPADYHRGSPSGTFVYVLRPTPIISVFHDGAIESVRISHLPPGYEYVSEDK